MKWQNHVLIGGSIAAAVNPALIPGAVLGATAPDWLEWIIRPFYRVKHRTITHYVIGWIGLAVFFALVWDYRHYGLAFALGGLSHVLADAFTVSGVPFGWWSESRFYLFGGKLRTGRPGEYIAAFGIALICGWITLHSPSVAIDKPEAASGFIPFFPDWSAYYRKGIVDAKEWKDNRTKFF